MRLMAGTGCFSVAMSLGWTGAARPSPESREDVMGQQWVFPQRFFQEHLKGRRGR